jgi:hypothetical protein
MLWKFQKINLTQDFLFVWLLSQQFHRQTILWLKTQIIWKINLTDLKKKDGLTANV